MHDLDMVRHGFAYAWAWYNWISNITASIVAFFIASLFWPKARATYKTYIQSHFDGVHKKLDAHHRARSEQARVHHEAHMDLVKANHQEVLETLASRPASTPAASRPRAARTTGLKKEPPTGKKAE